MGTSVSSKTSIAGLVRNLTDDTKKLLRQEIELVKAELSEKTTSLGKNAVVVAIGGCVAYAGLIVLLMSLGWLIAWGLQKAGLEPVFAGFIGLAVVGILIVATGVIFLMMGLKAFSKEPLAPQRTIHTIKRLKGNESQPTMVKPKAAPAPKRSSQEMQAHVVATEDRVADAMGELGQRLTPGYLNTQVKQRIAE